MFNWKMNFLMAYGGAALLVSLMYLATRLLWPVLIKNRWVLEDWDDVS